MLAWTLFLLSAAAGDPPGVGIDQRLGETLSLNLPLRDETGRSITLGEALDGKPAILALVYYRCPMLCNLELNGLLQGLLDLQTSAGKDFQVVTVSFDAAEGPELASAKRDHYLRAYGRPSARQGWRFLTGDRDPLARLCHEAGYRIRFDPATRQYAHGSALLLLTPAGRISRYLFGVAYPARELRLSLVEASGGRIGTASDRVLLYCLSFDGASGRYGLAIARLTQTAAAATVLGLGTLLFFLSRRKRVPVPA